MKALVILLALSLTPVLASAQMGCGGIPPERSAPKKAPIPSPPVPVPTAPKPH